jgi:hypothetical protein
MSKMEFIHKMNVIQNKNATKLILNQNRVNQAVAVIFPLRALFASMLALLNLPFAMSIDISSALSLSPFFRFSIILNQNRVNQAVMNFEKGNIGVKDGLSIHRQGLYKLPDIVEKCCSLDFNSSMFCKSSSVGSFFSLNSSIKSRASSALCVYFSPSLAVIFPLRALFASMLALLNLPFAMSIDISSALSLSEDLKAKEQLETAYAVLSGNSTALDISSAEVIISGQSNMPLNRWLC